MNRVVTLGESMLAFHVREPLSTASRAGVSIAGAEGNVAIGLARLGVPVAWLGRVGDDSAGLRVVRDLRGEGVDVRAVIDPGAQTGLLIKESEPAGRTSVDYRRRASAGSRLTPDDVGELPIAGARYLHLSGITPALSASASAAALHAAAVARDHGVPISFDVNHRSRLWDDRDAAESLRTFVSIADLVFAGIEEAELVTGAVGAPHAELLSRLRSLGPAEAVLKLGSRGAIATTGSELVEWPAVAVGVVDTVGAGDAFVAGYLAAAIEGGSLAARLDLATRAGAHVCTHPGDWEGAGRREQLAALASDRDPVMR